MMRYLLGPEMIWLLVYGIAVLFAAKNKAPGHVFDGIIEQSWLWVPLISLLTFGLNWIQSIELKWLTGRIWLSAFIAGHFILEVLTNAYSQQGPGIGMTYLVGMIFIFLALLAGSGLVAWLGK